MLIFLLFALLGLLSAGSAAVLFPIRQATSSWNPATLSPCTPIWRTATVYPAPVTVTVTVVDHPDTVTIVDVDSASVAQQFSTQGSIDGIEVTQGIENAPTNAPPPTHDPFTHTASAAVQEATEAPGDPNSVYYVPKEGPPQSTQVAVTTVTVMPTPLQPKVQGEINTTITSRSTQTATSTNYGVWNTSVSDVGSSTDGSSLPLWGAWNTSVAGTSTGGYGFPVQPSDDSGVLTVTSTSYVATVTGTSSTADSMFGPFGTTLSGYGPAITPASAEPATLVPRQTCTWVEAEGYGGWCNDWDGSTTISYSTYNTTVYPSQTKSVQPYPDSTSAAPMPGTSQPQECGEVGPFIIDFDELPAFSTGDNSTTLHPPVFNPFDHFWWGDCWTYAPPPNEPYPPHDGQHLAECITGNNNTVAGSPDAGLIRPTGFGAGPRNSNSAYWFNAHSAWVACDNGATSLNTTCQFNVTSWIWDGATETELRTDSYNLPPCWGNVNCRLHQIPFPGDSNGLTSLSFSATVDGETRTFYMDSLHLNWFDNSCDAGLTRISSRKVRRGV